MDTQLHVKGNGFTCLLLSVYFYVLVTPDYWWYVFSFQPLGIPRSAKLAGLQAKLEADHRLLRQLNDGYTVLNDCLDWITTQKKLQIAKQAVTVVEEHQQFFLPLLDLADLPNFPGALESMLAGLPDVPKDSKWSERQKQECKKLVIFHLDFNVPGVPQEHFIFCLDVLGMFVLSY